MKKHKASRSSLALMEDETCITLHAPTSFSYSSYCFKKYKSFEARKDTSDLLRAKKFKNISESDFILTHKYFLKFQ